jgi:hypothetical protein
MGRPDPLAAGQIPADRLLWTPREYFFKVFEIRMNEVRKQWQAIIDKVEGDIKQYVSSVDFVSTVRSVFTFGQWRIS